MQHQNMHFNDNLLNYSKHTNIFIIQNKYIKLYLTNYGATIIAFLVKDKFGKWVDIVLGYESLEEYLKDDYYFGSIIGQVANRIENGKFTLNNQEFKLSCNNNKHHLHGGNFGWNKQNWTCQQPNKQSVSFSLNTNNIEHEYKASVKTKITYTLINNELLIDYKATTDTTTIINLTNHTYFNLSGKNEPIGNHEIQLNSDCFFTLKENGIPTNKPSLIKNTPFDFSKPTLLNKALTNKDLQIQQASGIDHFFIKKGTINQLDTVAKLMNKQNGLILTIATTKQGVQVYTANFLNNVQGKYNKLYNKQYAICFECQAIPNAINNTNYNNLVILQPNSIYQHQDKYRIDIDT